MRSVPGSLRCSGRHAMRSRRWSRLLPAGRQLAARFAAQRSDLLHALVISTPHRGSAATACRWGYALQRLRSRCGPRRPTRSGSSAGRFFDFDRARRVDSAWFAAFSDYTRSRAAVSHVKRTMRQLVGSCTQGARRRAAAHRRPGSAAVGPARPVRAGRPGRVSEYQAWLAAARDRRRRACPHIEQPQAFLDALAAVAQEQAGGHAAGLRPGWRRCSRSVHPKEAATTGKPERPAGAVPRHGPHPAWATSPCLSHTCSASRFGRAKPGAPVGAARIPADPPPRRRPAHRRGDHRDRPVAAGGEAGGPRSSPPTGHHRAIRCQPQPDVRRLGADPRGSRGSGGSLWMLAAFAAATGQVHRLILGEERELGDRFGDEFGRYCAGVPRYLPRWPRKGHRPLAAVLARAACSNGGWTVANVGDTTGAEMVTPGCEGTVVDTEPAVRHGLGISMDRSVHGLK